MLHFPHLLGHNADIAKQAEELRIIRLGSLVSMSFTWIVSHRLVTMHFECYLVKQRNEQTSVHLVAGRLMCRCAK